MNSCKTCHQEIPQPVDYRTAPSLVVVEPIRTYSRMPVKLRATGRVLKKISKSFIAIVGVIVGAFVLTQGVGYISCKLLNITFKEGITALEYWTVRSVFGLVFSVLIGLGLFILGVGCLSLYRFVCKEMQKEILKIKEEEETVNK